MIKKLIAILLVSQTFGYCQVGNQGAVTYSGQVIDSTGSPAPPPFTITTVSEPSGSVGTTYTSNAITTINGTAPISFSTSLDLTGVGLSFSGTTGQYSGDPTTAGSYTFNITAKDSSNPAKSTSATLTINIAASGPPSGGHNENCNSSDQWIGPASKPMPSGTPGGNASAPQACNNTAMANTPSPGSTVTVSAGSCSDLQSKINAAVAGETIIVPSTTSPGVQAVYANCRIQPAATGNASNWITVETDQMAALPPEGSRISPAWVGIASMAGYPQYSQPANPGIYLPKIMTSAGGNWDIQFQSTAAYWRFIGIEPTSPAGSNASQLIQGLAGANHIILDRIDCHGGNSPFGKDTDDIDDCVSWDGITYGAIIDSYVFDTHCGGHGCAQSNAVGLGGNSTSPSGPIKVVNDFLSSAGEVIFSGGSGAPPPTVILPTSDDEIRLNHLFKPLFWKAGDPSYLGVWFELDNCMEMKNAQRLYVDGNIMENSTGAQGTQQGNCIVIGPRNQSSGFTGTANSDGNGNITWVSGSQQFNSNQVSQYCALSLHCMFVMNSKAYQVASVTDATHLVLRLCSNGCPNAGGTVAGTSFPPVEGSTFYGAALPGLNPNAVGNDIIITNNYIHGAARVASVAIAVSNNGDLPSSLQRVYFANNAADWIDGWLWNNDAPGAGDVWGTGIQIMSAPSLNISGLVVAHNTFVDYLTGGKPGVGPDFSWGMKGNTVNYLQVTDNLSTAGVALGVSAESIITAATPKAQLCWDHNILVLATNPFGPNGLGTYISGNNAPYPVAGDSGNCPFGANGNSTIADFNAADFTAINLPTSTVNFQLTASSPGHNAAGDQTIGADIGVNWTTIQNLIANVGPLLNPETVLSTSDSALNTGSAITGTCTISCGSGVNSIITKGSNKLWLMFTDTFGISSGSGTITQAYPGTGSMTTTVNVSGLNNTAVNAYPFVLYGCDPFSDCYNGQAPQFPAQLSSMTNLLADINYTFSGTITGSDVDLLFDEWVCNNSHPSSQSQCLEVEILPYYSFLVGSGATFVKTITVPVTINGTATTMQFDELKGGNILFVPHTLPGTSAQELKFDLLTFLNEGVSTYGAAAPCSPVACSSLAGVELGTEFGDSATQNYSLSFSKIEIDQILP